mmetsp:Transcript_10243/g.37944  ORF Transcript_10243/g.37944 Transcript_10243/m.37944 type:complete len:243 (-) Transcript_10243:251-979(-)
MRASPSALSHSPTGPLPAAGSPLGSAMVVWPPTPPLAVLDGFLHFPFPESYPPLPFPGCAFPAPPEMRPPRSSSSSPPSSSSLSSSPPAPPSSPRSISIAALSSSSTPWGSFEVVLIAHGETSRDPRGVSLRESLSLAGSAPPGTPCVDTAPPGAWFLKAAAAISLFWPTPVSPSMASRSSSCASATDRSVPTGSPPKPTSGGLPIIATYRGRTALGKEVFPSKGVQTRHAPFVQATRSATS